MTTGLATTTAVCGGTAAATVTDDLPEPYAAISLVCVTAIAVSAVCRLIYRLDHAEKNRAEERNKRERLQEEYDGLVDDYNDLVIEQAQQAEGNPQYKHEHQGPRCQCSHRGPGAYLTLVDLGERQESG